MATKTVIRDLAPGVTTFSTPFNRFAPFGYRKFVAVGLRSAAIMLHDKRVLVLNPIQLEKSVQDKLNSLGGVHFVASDLGHHLYVKDYLETWPGAKAIGVNGLEGKRKDVKWDFVYESAEKRPEDVFGFADDVESVMFEGFITRAVAWFHRPSGTLIQSDLLMNLPCTEVCAALIFKRELTRLAIQSLIIGGRPVVTGFRQRRVSSVDVPQGSALLCCHNGLCPGATRCEACSGVGYSESCSMSWRHSQGRGGQSGVEIGLLVVSGGTCVSGTVSTCCGHDEHDCKEVVFVVR